MSYLQENNTENLAARITYKGRRKIAEGNFNISYFQIGDSEYDYGFSMFDGELNSAQKVLMPFDKDSQVKYPYKISQSTLTGTTYGTPIQASETYTIKNNVGPAGYVSGFGIYDCDAGTGTTVECGSDLIDITALNGTSELIVNNGSVFNNSDFVTLYFNALMGSESLIASGATCLIYRVVSVSGNTLTLDRNTPNYSTGTTVGSVTVICNDCTFPGLVICNGTVDVSLQQDPWTQNIVWSQTPAGLASFPIGPDEMLSGYTSNIYVSSKEYFGYNTSSGQTTNIGTTIVNSFNDSPIVPPEEQHSLAILHYSKASDILVDPWLTFKYEDYIDHTVDGEDYFEIYIPFIYYERNTGTTIGARFFMDTIDYYINSSAMDARSNQMKYRYLLDENNIKVGKIFVNHKVIVFDDQEIVAALEYKSNRRYTLPIPRLAMMPIDSQCGECGDINNPMLAGTGDTVFISYLLKYSGDTGLNGMHLNYYPKITGSTTATGDVAIKFNNNDFRFMQTGFTGSTVGYIADTFKILAQLVTTGEQPDPTQWRVIDYTSQIPNHIVGNLIDPANLRGARFIVNHFDYDDALLYDLEDYLGPFPDQPSTAPEFGDEQPFAGSIKVTRATDLQVMRYLINLPMGDFETTQNPSYIAGVPKRITEAALLDGNKEVLVIAKASSPIERTGSQVLSVKIDL